MIKITYKYVLWGKNGKMRVICQADVTKVLRSQKKSPGTNYAASVSSGSFSDSSREAL